ncbi:MAG: Asp-tRNA(Asn)/Glu-tRNA(Gln) amidotransferase subunit GatA [Propionibacteriaceae bacterium]
MSSLVTKTAAELAQLLASGEVSAVEVATEHFEQIAAVDGAVHAFLALDHDRALSHAAAIDQRRATGQELPTLAGVPIAVKDLISYEGLPTTAGSAVLEHYRPPYNATVTQRLLDAGLIILGKTNLDEFAMGSSTETSYFGPTHNPWDLDRIPGGSGGGSSAALAAFEAPLAIGTDTGGSIRQPAAVTGTIGIKPTYGGVSRYGILALASSLDQAGPCARTVLDAALLHEVMAGYDPMDSTSINQPVPDVVAAARQRDVRGMRIGIVKEFGGEGYAPGVEQRFAEAVEMLRAAGATITEVSCPSFEYALSAYYLILPAECSSNLARYDSMRYGLRIGDDGTRSTEEVMGLSRGAGFGDEVKRRIILGTYALSSGYYDAYYGSAQKVRTLIQRDFAAAFEHVDVLVSPSTPFTPFKIGEKLDDPMAMYTCDLCTIPANMAGTPAGSFPIGLAPEDGLPVGLQVIAPVLADDRIYRVGGALEDLLETTWGKPIWAQVPALADTKAVL